MQGRDREVVSWIEVLTGALGTLVLIDAHTGGRVRMWVGRHLAAPERVKDSDQVYGVAREAERILRTEGGSA